MRTTYQFTRTFSRDTENTVLIPHGLDTTPDTFTVEAKSDDAMGIDAATGNPGSVFRLEADSTNVTVIYAGGVPDGEDNLTYKCKFSGGDSNTL